MKVFILVLNTPEGKNIVGLHRTEELAWQQMEEEYDCLDKDDFDVEVYTLEA